MTFDTNMILIILPLALIHLVLVVICFLDWRKRKSFRYLPKIAWLFIFLLVQFAGAACYLFIGRKEEQVEETEK